MTNLNGKKKGVRMIAKIKKFHDDGLNISQIARVLGVTRGTVRKYLKPDLSENIEPKVYVAPWSHLINWKHVESETNFGLALSDYWEENVSDKNQITYVSFWREYKRRFPNIPIDLHKIYEPGLRCEIDFKGKDSGFGFINSETGEFVNCRLFGNILCFSQLFYPQATLSEKQEDLFNAMARSFEYFGGVPEITVFDNAKAQVTKADRYDPDLNPEFAYFCDVYNTAPIATRSKKPKDKNLIENALGVFWRWVQPKLRKKSFYSLHELNQALIELANVFNNKVQKKYGISRYNKFNSIEKCKLKALPKNPYFHGHWRKHKAHPDCHIQYGYNFYSIPFECRHKELDVRVSGGLIEVFDGLNRIAIHQVLSSCSRGRYITCNAHLPPAHKAILEQTPQWAIEESEKIGPNTNKVISRLINESRHPLMFLRRCQGILRLKKRYTKEGLETACQFFKDISLSDIKLSNIERVIVANAEQISSNKKIKRKKNENLRGQSQWAQTFH